MKKILLLCITVIFTLIVAGCPQTPGLLSLSLNAVPEWIDEISESDRFIPDENTQRYFNVSYSNSGNLEQRNYTDEDGECWFEFQNLGTNAARLYLYFGDDGRLNSNYIYLGETYDHDYVPDVSERNGVYEFNCNSNNISPVHSDAVEKDENGWYKIKHIKFVKLNDGYNLFLTVNGEELGPYHFTKTEEECK